MSDDDSSSEDDDYKPSKKELSEADAEGKREKRKRATDGEADIRQARVGRSNAKVEDLWQQLKGSASSRQQPASNVKLPVASVAKPLIPAADREWMKQLGISSFPTSAARAPLLGKPKAKEQAPAGEIVKGVPPKSPASVATDTEATGRALAAAKAAITGVTTNAEGHVSVQETRRFAGKNIQVTKQATLEEAEKLKEKEQEKKSGIDAVLASLEAAKKVNVLDKSRDDWGSFKKTDTQLEAELDAYRKSGGKYLDKVDFLKRAELREYETERDQRLAGDIRSRGRT